jgi:hypothetical protein
VQKRRIADPAAMSNNANMASIYAAASDASNEPKYARPSFWRRLWLAIIVPWRILFDAVFAHRVNMLVDRAFSPAADSTGALQLLAILQREGRLIDFLEEDIASATDAEIGAAARVVHEGCRRGLKDYLVLEPVRAEVEGTAVVLEPGFDAARIRVTGNVLGQPPFRGRLAHHGWQVREIRLPALSAGRDPKVVAPAEVEL